MIQHPAAESCPERLDLQKQPGMQQPVRLEQADERNADAQNPFTAEEIPDMAVEEYLSQEYVQERLPLEELLSEGRNIE